MHRGGNLIGGINEIYDGENQNGNISENNPLNNNALINNINIENQSQIGNDRLNNQNNLQGNVMRLNLTNNREQIIDERTGINYQNDYDEEMN